MRRTDRSITAITIAVVLTSFTLRELTTDHSYLFWSLLLTVLIGLVTAVLRRRHLPGLVVFAGQLVVLGIGLLGVAAALPRVVATGGYWDNLFRLLPAAFVHMREQAAPMEANVGVTFLLVAAVGLVAVLTDLMAATLHRTAWTLAPLASLYLVPAVGIVGDIGTIDFLVLAIGYLLILGAEGMNATSRWTRGLTHDSAQGIGSAEPVVARAAGLIGVPALVLTVVVALLVPMLGIAGWGGGSGQGNDGPLQLTDPTADLRRNLNLPTDRVVIHYTSENPNGEYLRMASLPVFNNNGWLNSSISVKSGRLPSPPGLTSDTPKAVRTQIQVLQGYDSGYLPVPYAPQSFSAAGSWGYDPNSLVILSTDRNKNNAIAGLHYEVSSLDIAPGLPQLSNAAAGTPQDIELTGPVPKDLPQDLIDLTERVTKNANTPAAKAAAIQAFLRSSQFTYSTETLPGNGYQALENFLLKDHTGYCEQFAAAMAMMARIVGIPSRFAVGFLPGTKVGTEWQVSAHNQHAWPELYFAGEGWVRYEPTPSVATAPGYTLNNTNGTSAEPSDQPSSSTSNQVSTGPSQVATPVPSQLAVVASGPSTGQLIALSIGAVAMVVALSLLVAPSLLRIRLRRCRLTHGKSPGGRVEAAWAELRDTKVDLRSGWPSGSPRVIARQLGTDLDPDAASGLNSLAVLVERARYARTFDDPAQAEGVDKLASQLRTALLAPHRRGRRLRATLVPRSLWLNRRAGRSGPKRG